MSCDRRGAIGAELDVQIVIELIGGLNPAEQIVRSALVGQVGGHGEQATDCAARSDLLQLAASKGCQIEFGASVAGGVPFFRAPNGPGGDRPHGNAGILNGTCNYILS
jgi:homoserine dehydrogenase